MPETHKLSTILFGDIAGYTSMMQEDESTALATLETFKSILARKVPQYNGRIVQFFGDACLLSFDSNQEGVSCAMALQKDFQDQDIPIRIGMHSGEVVFTEDNVFGDGVNIASRVESIGVPGGILVSKAVRDQIRNKIEFELVSLGLFEFKNVSEPIEVYAISNPGFIVPKRGQLKGKFKTQEVRSNRNLLYLIAGILIMIAGVFFVAQNSTEGSPEKNSKAAFEGPVVNEYSIAILPFKDMSVQKDQEYFGDGIAEEIINTLTSLTELKVSGRTSSFSFKERNVTIEEIGKVLKVKHVLEGSVRKYGEKIRITAQLNNAQTGFQMWSQTFDRDYFDIFQIQDEISSKIGSSILGKLAPDQIDKITNNSRIDPRAFELYLEARFINRYQFYPLKLDKYFRESEAKFQEAITLAPNYALAHAGLADLYDTKRYVLTDSAEMKFYEDLKIKEIQTAMELNPNLPYVQKVQGWVYLDRQIRPIEFQGAFEAFKKAYLLDKRNTDGLVGLFWLYDRIGLIEDCRVIMDKALELAPHDLRSYYDLANFYSRYGFIDKVIEVSKEGLSHDETYTPLYRRLAVAYFHQNNMAQSLDAITKIKELNIEFYEANQHLQIIESIINGNIEKAEKINPQSWTLLLYKKDYEKLNPLIFKYLKRYRSTKNWKAFSRYTQLKNHPYYRHLQEDPDFKLELKHHQLNKEKGYYLLPRVNSFL